MIDPQEHMGIAIKLITSRRKTMDRAEVVSIAWEAINDAIPHHDPEKGKFGTILRWYIWKAIKKRDNEESGSINTPDWQLRRYGIPTYTAEDHEFPHYHDSDPCINEDFESVVEVMYDVLSPRERYCVIAYHAHGLTLKEIGKHTGVSNQRISKVIKRAVKKLKEAVR